MKILVINSDFDACYRFRLSIPFTELKKYGVEVTYQCFLPSDPLIAQDKLLIDLVGRFDIVIVQRCYLYPLVSIIRSVCEYLGKPLVYETDDDYFNLIPSNPAYYSIVADQELFNKFYHLQELASKSPNKEEAQRLYQEAQDLIPALEQSRAEGLAGYAEILKFCDFVTVSTEELARTIRPYNKNVFVFENNLDSVYPFKDSLPLERCLVPTGEPNQFTINIPNQLGLYQIPNFRSVDHGTMGTQLQMIPRIGYSCSPSHRFEDFGTISRPLNNYMNKNKGNQFLVLLGDHAQDNFWFRQHFNDQACVFSIPPTQYEKYNCNLRNIDIGLCPLAPTIFNMSKSDLKMLEYGSWGIPTIAPRFITYSRHWIENENCLMYYNEEEFSEQLEKLCKSHTLRQKLGKNAMEYVSSQRLEKFHSEKRYEFYNAVMRYTKPLSIFEAA
jgi:hypothetical protein